jgi:hypothetical protein
MIRRFLVSGAEDIDILLMLLMAGAGIALAYVINFMESDQTDEETDQ